MLLCSISPNNVILSNLAIVKLTSKMCLFQAYLPKKIILRTSLLSFSCSTSRHPWILSNSTCEKQTWYRTNLGIVHGCLLGDPTTFGWPLDFVRIFVLFLGDPNTFGSPIVFVRFFLLISSQFCSLSTSITTWPYDLKLLPMITTGLT